MAQRAIVYHERSIPRLPERTPLRMPEHGAAVGAA
jgi:hypothetical protein